MNLNVIINHCIFTSFCLILVSIRETEAARPAPRRKGMTMELLDQLREFSGVYHEYARSSSRLASQNRLYNDMVKLTPNGYFEACDDRLIGEVREARSAIDSAQRRIDALQASLPQKEHQLQSALAQCSGQRAQLEAQISGSKSEASKKKWTRGLLWFLLAGPFITGIVFGVISIIVGLIAGTDSPAAFMVVALQALVYIGIGVYLVMRVSKKCEKETATAQSEISGIDASATEAQARFQNEKARINEEIANLESAKAQKQAFLSEHDGEARNKAGNLWANALSAQGDKLTEAIGECQGLRSRLVDMGTIADEDDWFAVDSLIKLISSGRASDLKEALRLFDESERHSQVMMAAKAQFDQGEALRRQLASDLGSIMQNQDYLIQQAARHHHESAAQQERHHAEQMHAMEEQLNAQRIAAAAAAVTAAASVKTASDMGGVAADVRDIKDSVTGGDR